MHEEDPPSFLDALIGTVDALEKWFAATSTTHTFIGGLVVAFMGEPRVTADVDGIIEVDPDDLDEFLATGERFGVAGRDPDTAEFARRHFVLKLVHVASGIQVDLSLGFTEFEAHAIRAAVRVTAQGVTFPVLQPEDLLVMKAFARRTKDIADIPGVLNRHPEVDLASVRAWLRLFDEGSEEPSYLAQFDRLVAEWRERG